MFVLFFVTYFVTINSKQRSCGKHWLGTLTWLDWLGTYARSHVKRNQKKEQFGCGQIYCYVFTKLKVKSLKTCSKTDSQEKINKKF